MVMKPKVLVVDDDSVVCRSIDRVLSDGGYSVDTIMNGTVALDRMVNERYDVAFVDLRMPDIDGMDIVRSIRRMHPDVKVVIVTGYGTQAVCNEAAALGVPVVSKPLTPQSISDAAKVQAQEIPEVKISIPPAGLEEEKPLAKSILELALSPLLGLAFIIFPPFIGFALLFMAIGKKAAPHMTPVADVLKLIGGSLLGLLFVIFFPVIGFAALFWILFKKVYKTAGR